jgi:hypothetical protein
MTITQETPMDAARRLAAGALLSGFKFEALHTYTDREANPLYWRIRAKHPATGKKWIRPMKLTGTGYELREPRSPPMASRCTGCTNWRPAPTTW